jgi:hypothetical protein
MPKLFLATALLALGGGLATAHAENLAGDAIRKLVGGKQVFLSTPYGVEFPLHYRSNGKVSGDASRFSMASMLAPKEDGSWWVTKAKLCQKWPTWYDGRTICFTIRKTGPASLAWTRDDGLKGTARIAD